MNPEQLSDAMNELPQELLEETQAARSRRRLRWKPLAAAAACLLLAAGAWALAGRPAHIQHLLNGVLVLFVKLHHQRTQFPGRLKSYNDRHIAFFPFIHCCYPPK